MELLAARRTGHPALLAIPLLAVSIATWAMLATPEPGTGTMGQDPAGYIAMWTGMTAAMMLSPLAWFASGNAAGIRRDAPGISVRLARTTSLAGGHAVAWLLAGVVALVPGLHSMGMS